MTMTRTPFLLLPLLTILGACSHTPAPLDSGIAAPARWQSPAGGTAASAQWWTTFNSAQLSQLIEQARQGSHDLRAAMARVRQAQADLRIAGGPLLPRLDASADAYHQRLLRGQGYSEQDTSNRERTYRYFNTALTTSYELDFWGKNAAARDSARLGLQATARDRDTLELSLTSSVADTYLSALAAREQARIAALNLENADKVLSLVRTRFQAGRRHFFTGNDQGAGPGQGHAAAQRPVAAEFFRHLAQHADSGCLRALAAGSDAWQPEPVRAQGRNRICLEMVRPVDRRASRSCLCRACRRCSWASSARPRQSW